MISFSVEKNRLFWANVDETIVRNKNIVHLHFIWEIKYLGYVFNLHLCIWVQIYYINT
jgi:hypothetical protein